ncbi:DUF4325 domain-containing protein [Candidatus Collierbacteria bacterium CG17_big_fil_post_rev_8_21_14_2_50_45_7]|uniref:DUF4325 domain-containing protein n=2 Tax=Candidatus Collieribacteriota TaxID=1752725 RepID=A0A2H0WZY2_9BACT|nr:MAG: DUF4325 domain-containing protein [Candidatus Collierbacteria bacterium CG09_land_8_20_14_0_10_46_12]PIW07578.1 MAG: DUF4325 domain-containing protein [Candidatus Collierbacteria bacterium CG17_big_fil_post_rev_8_21_14_2_50_45_7]
MIININKFGTTLISRPAGKEAHLAFQSSLNNLGETEVLEVDFDGVITLSPSWADEFVTPLLEKYKKQLKLVNISNASVVETLKTLKILPE